MIRLISKLKIGNKTQKKQGFLAFFIIFIKERDMNINSLYSRLIFKAIIK